MDSNNEEFDNNVYIIKFSKNSSLQDDIDDEQDDIKKTQVKENVRDRSKGRGKSKEWGR